MLRKSIESLQEKTESGRTICKACARMCAIPESSRGFCFVRKNIHGDIYLTAYGVVSAIQVDPIEKKPFNHFMPGSKIFGIGMLSCNFGCLFCQNHNISKQREIKGAKILPCDIVKMAKEEGADGIAFTYNEPTIYIEYVVDVADMAHKNGLFTLMVTNGYMSRETVELLKGRIDAVVVDFKGNGERVFSNKYEAVVSSNPIKDALIEIKKAGIHIEITDLVIPEVGDSLSECDKLTKWINKNLGADTPIHFTRFYPDYKMMDLPQTQYDTLLEHYKTARRNGMRYVYIGNIHGNRYESTYCPDCGTMAIERNGLSVLRYSLSEDGKCINCGTKIPIKGRYMNVGEPVGIYTLY